MNGFLDGCLVGLILLAGFGYAAYALGPKSLRARLLSAMAVLLGHLPAMLGTRGAADRLAAKARSTSGAACGGCDNCGSEPAAKSAPGSSTEVRIPLARIGKRH